MSDQQTPAVIVHRLPAERSIMPGPFGSSDSLDHAWRVAQALAASPMVPEHLRNPHSVMIAIQIAASQGEDLFSVLQGIQIIKGKVGFSGTYLLAKINRSGLYPEGVAFETTGSGDGLAVTMKGTRRNGRVDAFTVSLAMAKADGWVSNPKYKSIPEVMLTNRAIGFFLRYRCPEVMTGATVADEIDDRVDLATTPAPAVVEVPAGTGRPTRKGMPKPRELPERQHERDADQVVLDALTGGGFKEPIPVPTGDGFDGEET